MTFHFSDLGHYVVLRLSTPSQRRHYLRPYPLPPYEGWRQMWPSNQSMFDQDLYDVTKVLNLSLLRSPQNLLTRWEMYKRASKYRTRKSLVLSSEQGKCTLLLEEHMCRLQIILGHRLLKIIHLLAQVSVSDSAAKKIWIEILPHLRHCRTHSATAQERPAGVGVDADGPRQPHEALPDGARLCWG